MIPRPSQRAFVDTARRAYDLAKDTERSARDERDYVMLLARTIRWVEAHPELLDGRHVQHNLGERRVNWIRELTGDEGGTK